MHLQIIHVDLTRLVRNWDTITLSGLVHLKNKQADYLKVTVINLGQTGKRKRTKKGFKNVLHVYYNYMLI